VSAGVTTFNDERPWVIQQIIWHTATITGARADKTQHTPFLSHTEAVNFCLPDFNLLVTGSCQVVDQLANRIWLCCHLSKVRIVKHTVGNRWLLELGELLQQAAEIEHSPNPVVGDDSETLVITHDIIVISVVLLLPHSRG